MRLDHPRFVYTPSGRTDIEASWREKHRWIPPSESPDYQTKWATYQTPRTSTLTNAQATAHTKPSR